MNVGLFMACLSTTFKLLHNYKLSMRKSDIVYVSVLPCFCLVWRKWERCRIFTFNAVTSFALCKWPTPYCQKVCTDCVYIWQWTGSGTSSNLGEIIKQTSLYLRGLFSFWRWFHQRKGEVNNLWRIIKGKYLKLICAALKKKVIIYKCYICASKWCFQKKKLCWIGTKKYCY
jgi:hypothetical protein